VFEYGGTVHEDAPEGDGAGRRHHVVVIGSGFGTSFRGGQGHGNEHYLDYFFPGALIMIVLFTAIFTMMSVIEDRK